MIEVGDYVVKKYQRKTNLVKTGGVVVSIDGAVATITDGKNFKPYLLSELTNFKPHHNTILGVHLYA